MKATVIANYEMESGSPRVDVRIGNREYGIDLYKHPEAQSLKVGQIVQVERKTNSPYVYLS